MKYPILPILLILGTLLQTCSQDIDLPDIHKASNSSVCGGKQYDSAIHRCIKGEIVGSCRGKDYYPQYEQCINGAIPSSSSQQALPSSSSPLSSSSIQPSSSSSSSSLSSSSLSSSSSSSSSAGSSSANSNSSSSAISLCTDYADYGISCGAPITHGGETYQTAVIGDQTLIMRNLNTMHSQGNGNSWCYNDNPANCAKYGRLYDWAAAMDLPSACNSSSCAGLITSKHKGLCPTGFHIPKTAELTSFYISALKLFNDMGDLIDSDSGYDFSVLLGGWRNASGSYSDGGMSAYWWAASEVPILTSNAFYQYMYSPIPLAESKSMGYSIVCVKN